MELARISGQDVWLIVPARQGYVEIGQAFALMERPVRGQTPTDGLIVQITEFESVQYDGVMQEALQRLLTTELGAEAVYDAEMGMDRLKGMKLARARIRKRVLGGQWLPWDGWITSRNIVVAPVPAQDLLGRVLPEPKHPLNSWAWYDTIPIRFCGTRCDLTNVLVGERGSGKSHQGKQLILSLAAAGVPVLVFDPNAEYVRLPGAQHLIAGENFRLNLAEVGWRVLLSMVQSLAPLATGSASEGAFSNGLAGNFRDRRHDCERRGVPFNIDLDYLIKEGRWPSEGTRGDYVIGAIRDRLGALVELNLFASTTVNDAAHTQSATMFAVYESACAGHPAIIDLTTLGEGGQAALVRAVNIAVEGLAAKETESGAGRYPHLIYDECQEYISERALLGLLTRARHLGISTTFITNSPSKLPDSVFKTADNLILMPLHDKDDIRAVARNAFCDADTVASFASRLKPRQALIVGRLTDRFPLVVQIDDLPADVQKSGVTKSTWARFTLE